MRVKQINTDDVSSELLSGFPNFHVTGSVAGMKRRYYGSRALLVRCGSWIYDVTSAPDMYFTDAR